MTSHAYHLAAWIAAMGFLGVSVWMLLAKRDVRTCLLALVAAVVINLTRF